MAFLSSVMVLALASLCLPNTTMADVVLDKKTMELTLTAGELSNLVYSARPSSDGYDMVKSFLSEPDQALVAKKDGYCYGVFRGTTQTTQDWSQNLVIGKMDVCGSNTTTGEGEPPVCCTVREGYYYAYYGSSYCQDFEAALRHCAKDCLEPDECVVLTGHSQGGAIAAVAAIQLADLNPYVITFGQPPTLAPGCPYVSSERWYRWVNTRATDVFGISYDPIPFTPGLGTDCFGHFLVLGGDSADGVAYLGLDDHRTLLPVDSLAVAHTIKAAVNDTETLGYVNRLAALVEYNKNKTLYLVAKATAQSKTQSALRETTGKGFFKSYQNPISTVGFRAGFLCSDDQECMSGVCDQETSLSWFRCVGLECKNDSECDTGRCDSGLCGPKLGSCQSCDEDSDCASESCYGLPLFRCTGPQQLMDENCACIFNHDCRSGRCEGVNPRICEALLPMEGRCNEDSDCASGYCSWSFRCADPSKRETETKDEDTALNWRPPVAIVAIILLCSLIKLGVDYWFAPRADYEEIVDAELNNTPLSDS